MGCTTVKYVNLTDRPIRFVKGLSGVPWPGCDSEPGGVVEAPDTDGYARLCLEAGYTRLTPDLELSLSEDAQLKAMIEEEERAKRTAAEPNPQADQPTAAGSAPAATDPQPDTGQPTKGGNKRGRSNRSPEA